MSNIIIYGGSFAGTAAAITAATMAPDAAITVVIPDPVSNNTSSFGSIGTIGGQNFFDKRLWDYTETCNGSFERWRSIWGQFYNTDAMANQLKEDVEKHSNITVLYGYDIISIEKTASPVEITSISVKKINRNPRTGFIQWGTQTQTISGTVFIDASDDGRLTRLTHARHTVGRYDWPSKRLDADEKGSSGLPRQQAATLMFKVTGIDVNATNGYEDMIYTQQNDIWAGYGGTKTYKENDAVVDFNHTYGPKGYAIKPINIAQDGKDSEEWWINTLLVFDVDGRAHQRDKETSRFPEDMRPDYKTVDQAWADAQKFIKKNRDLLDVLKQFRGFSQVKLVKDASGNPVVGTTLYLRETIHTTKHFENQGHDTENTNYHLTTSHCHKAGSSSTSGGDTQNYKTRIGLNYYWSDINAYKFDDLKNSSDAYIWGGELAQTLREDLNTTQHPLDGNSPTNPVYIPFNALTTNDVANLLIPGYATGASSFAWAEVRVIPNLCVLGDAAGVAAAYAYNTGKHPLCFASKDIEKIQDVLTDKIHARIEKT